jgi:hypothetical protein
MNEENKYETKDLAEAAVLLVMKRSLSDIRRDGNTCWFIFEDKKRCEELSKQFFFDTLLVDARTYFEIITRLKNRIFSR